MNTDWVMKITVGDWTSSGLYDPDDRRMPLFFEKHPNLDRVLELGCLEGGHTLALAKRCRSVVAIDGREANIEMAKSVIDKAGLTNVEFRCHDLENPLPADIGKFSVVFCCGVLYHLQNPVALLKRLRDLTDELFISTAVVSSGSAENEGMKGWWYAEPVEARTAGMRSQTFWPVCDDLLKAIRDCGFDDVYCENAEDIVRKNSHLFYPTPFVNISARSANEGSI